MNGNRSDINHAGSNFEKISIDFLIRLLVLHLGGLLCPILPKQRQQFFLIAVSIEQILATLISESEQLIICSFLEQILDDIIIELFLRFIHLHLECTEIMEKRKAILLINDPIQISSMLDEHVRDQEAYLFILETCWLFNQSE